jgi:hypothetical protein
VTLGRKWRRVAGGMVIVVGLGACTTGGEESDSPTTTTLDQSAQASMPTTLDSKVSAAVISGYEAYWDALIAASDPPEPEDPELAAHATGEELKKAKELLAAQKRFGEVTRGTFDVDPTVQSVDGDRATVADCWKPKTSLFDAASGELKYESPASGRQLSVDLEFDGERWKVARITTGGACQVVPPLPEDNGG